MRATRAWLGKANLVLWVSIGGTCACIAWAALAGDPGRLTWLFGVLALGAVGANLFDARTEAQSVSMSGAALAAIIAIALFGPAAAFAVIAIAEVVSWAVERYRATSVFINLLGGGAPMLIAGTVFEALRPETDGSVTYYLVLALAAVLVLVLNLLFVAALRARSTASRSRRSSSTPRASCCCRSRSTCRWRSPRPASASSSASPAASSPSSASSPSATWRSWSRPRATAASSTPRSHGACSRACCGRSTSATRAPRAMRPPSPPSRATSRTPPGCRARSASSSTPPGCCTTSASSRSPTASPSAAACSTTRTGRRSAATLSWARTCCATSASTARSRRSCTRTTSGSTAAATRSGCPADEIPEAAKIIAVAEVYDTLTAHDTYRTPVSSFEALTELRRVSGTQLDGRYVEILARVLAGSDISYRHADSADFGRELDLERRINDAAAS